MWVYFQWAKGIESDKQKRKREKKGRDKREKQNKTEREQVRMKKSLASIRAFAAHEC
jgi:hypothetical protein